MHRASWVVLVSAAVLAVPAASSCSSGSHGSGSGPTDAGGDTTFPSYDAGVFEGGDDGGAFFGDAGEAGPLPVPPSIYLVNASPDAPALRFCLGLGSPDAGVLVTAGFAPTPDHVVAGTPYPGIFPGFGALIDDHGLDLDTLTVDVFAIDAANATVATDLYDGGPDGGIELPCEALIGTDGRGNASDGGGTLRPGQDYWTVGTIAMGQLGHGTTWLAAVTGCIPGDGQGAALCPAGYSASTGDLLLRTWPLDDVTVVDGGALGAQFAQASSEWDNFAHTAGGATTAGFLVPGTGAADAGSTAIPLAEDAGFGSLQPSTLAAVSGLTFDGTSAFFATIVEDGGAAVAPTPVALPLVSSAASPASVESFTWGASVPDAGALRNGAGFVFVLVGNPAASSLYVNPADGGAATGADAGVLNGHYPHFLAFPVAGP